MKGLLKPTRALKDPFTSSWVQRSRPRQQRSRRARDWLCDAVAPATTPASTVKKVSIVQLGCPKNVVDGEVLLGDLSRTGFEVINDNESADAIIINTCTFVEDAKKESLDAIMDAVQLNEDGRNRRIVVTGCLAQRYGKELAESMPELDLIMGFENYANLPGALGGSSAIAAPQRSTEPSADAPSTSSSSATGSRLQVGAATVPFRPEAERFRLTPKHSAYLRVAEGCNHACTFCAIPGFRGKFRSKPWAAVLDEAKALVASGVKELNLIAEDTNQYGQDRHDGRGLAQLLHELGKLDGLAWIRILYAYPSYFTDDLVDEIANNSKVCKYLDMPLQHISNLTLLSMNRPPKEHTTKLLTKLRERIPGLVLRTTFISGFPGETAEQHKELVAFCKEFKFERMGAFAYSEEDGTPAATFPEQVSEKIRQRRRDELISMQQRISEEFAERLVGQEVDVLVEGYNEDGFLVGRTQWDAPDVDPVVFITQSEDPAIPPAEMGQMRRCLVVGNSLFDLEAVPVL